MADNLKRRAEGQLWIDRNAPHGLKYYTHEEIYQITPEEIYTLDRASETIKAGSVVAADGTKGFKLAQFPRDIDRVIGICPIDITAGDTNVETSILKSGTIELPTIPTNSTVFQHQSGDVTWDSNLVGAPVYWFIGRIYKSGSSYSYEDPATHKGQLTLATPSGMRWNTGTNCDDNTLNVGYSNLPIIGTIAEYEDNKVLINVNISKFESSLEWNWPYYYQYNDGSGNKQSDEIKISGDSVTEIPIIIRHGLFPTVTGNASENFYNFRTRCFCDAIIIEGGNNDTEHLGLVKTENYYGLNEGETGDTDRRTEIIVKGLPSFLNGKRIDISGKVVYGFVKQYE